MQGTTLNAKITRKFRTSDILNLRVYLSACCNLWNILFMLSNVFESLGPVNIIRFLNVYKSSSSGSIKRKEGKFRLFLSTAVSFAKWQSHNISSNLLID